MSLCLVIATCSAVAAQSEQKDYEKEIRNAYESQDVDNATKLLVEWAKTGNSRAQYNLASNYERGIGVEADPVRAFQLMEKAALGGYPKAFINLSAYYYSGVGTSVNMEKALAWRTKSAEEGNIESIQILVYSFYLGTGLSEKVDKARSIEWIKQGVQLNDNFSIYCMGMFYYFGLNEFKQDYDKAKSYWITLGDESPTLFIDNLVEGFLNGTFGLSQSTIRSQFWAEHKKKQLSKMEERLGHKNIFPPRFIQVYAKESGMVQSMLNN